jgi:hypothetical protein
MSAASGRGTLPSQPVMFGRAFAGSYLLLGRSGFWVIKRCEKARAVDRRGRPRSVTRAAGAGASDPRRFPAHPGALRGYQSQTGDSRLALRRSFELAREFQDRSLPGGRLACSSGLSNRVDRRGRRCCRWPGPGSPTTPEEAQCSHKGHQTECSISIPEHGDWERVCGQDYAGQQTDSDDWRLSGR